MRPRPYELVPRNQVGVQDCDEGYRIEMATEVQQRVMDVRHTVELPIGFGAMLA
jgi:hypothetical protein